ncbi:MAG: glutamate decarboxylase [Phycisphaeraceae bacterium]|nr:hypothetical protein [Phycisphaerales bacterium]MCB9860925.1 glutamate decarboxylase [Phycisphaeraceae bacterium]
MTEATQPFMLVRDAETGETVQAHELLMRAAELASRFVDRFADPNECVTKNPSPEYIQQLVSMTVPEKGRSVDAIFNDLEAILDQSVLTGHTGFANQLFSGCSPFAVIGEWLTAVLNTSMYTYEVAPILTMMEMELVRAMCEKIGFVEDGVHGEGTFTPGGSLSNLVAMMLARFNARPGINRHGLGFGVGKGPRLVAFTSKDAHYSIERAAILLGLGLASVRSVNTDSEGRMDPADLQHKIDDAISRDEQPFFVSATAGTTVLAAYDPINAIADITENHGIWLHVDGAYGGSALMSERQRSLLDGVHRADSMTWCPHKMMGVPLMCSALLVKRRGQLAACTALKAEYLFHQDDEDACMDLGDMSIQCGRRVDALKLWLAWQALGDSGFHDRIDTMFSIAKDLRSLLRDRPAFRLVRDPDAHSTPCVNTVFDYVPVRLRDRLASEGATKELRKELSRINVELRARQKKSGRFFVNYASVDGFNSFRHVAGNPLVTHDMLVNMLDELEHLGANL